MMLMMMMFMVVMFMVIMAIGDDVVGDRSEVQSSTTEEEKKLIIESRAYDASQVNTEHKLPNTNFHQMQILFQKITNIVDS